MKTTASLFLILLTIPVCRLASQEYSKSYPFFFNNMYGLVNEKNEVILKPVFDHIEPFEHQWHNDYTIFSTFEVNNRIIKKGIIDKTGKVVVPAQYEKLEYGGNGYYCFHVTGKDTLEVIQIKRNKRVLKTPFLKYTNKRDLVSVELPGGKSRILVFENGKTKTFNEFVELIDMDSLRIYKVYTEPKPIVLNTKGKIINHTKETEFFSMDDYPVASEEIEEDDERNHQSDFASLQNILGAQNVTKVKHAIMDYPILAIYRNPADGFLTVLDLKGNPVFVSEGITEIKPLMFKSKRTPYLLWKKAGYWGLISLDGKIILDNAFLSIDKIDDIYFSVYHKSGYGGLAMWDGALKLPAACGCIK